MRLGLALLLALAVGLAVLPAAVDIGSYAMHGSDAAEPHGQEPGIIAVADTDNHRILVFHSNGTFAHSFGSYGSIHEKSSYLTYGQFHSPSGAAVGPDGRIVVADTGNRRIQVFSADGTFVNVLYFGRYDTPYAAAFAPNGSIVVAYSDSTYVSGSGRQYESRIQVFNADGTRTPGFGLYGDVVPSSPSDIAVGPDGQIAVSHSNSHTHIHRIQVYHPNGTLAIAFGSYGVGPGQFQSPSGVAIAPDGRIAVADTGNDRIQVFHPNGTLALAFGSYGAGPGQFISPSGVAIAPDGRIAVADTGNDRIQVFHPNGTLASAIGTVPDAGRGYAVPEVAVAPDGKIVVADANNHRIHVYHPNGTLASAFGSFGEGRGQIQDMKDIAVAPDGKIVVTDSPHSNGLARRIQVFNADGTPDLGFGPRGDGTAYLRLISNYPCYVRSYDAPQPISALAVAPDGKIVVAYNSGSRNYIPDYHIRVLNADGTCDLDFGLDFQSTARTVSVDALAVAPDGRILVAYSEGVDRHREGRILVHNADGTRADPPRISAYAVWPSRVGNVIDMAVAPDGRIAVTHAYSSRIHVLNADGTPANVFATFGDFFRWGPRPSSMAVAPDGGIVTADTYNDHIQVFHPNGTRALVFPSSLAREPWTTDAASDGPHPHGMPDLDFATSRVGASSVAVAPDGSIVTADASYHRILVRNANVTPAFYIGSFGAGPGQFDYPSGVAVAPDGRIVVSDTGNHRVQVFSGDGTYSFGFGSRGNGTGQFDYPSGVAVAPDGRIVVSDTGNHRIQVFDADGAPTLIIGSTGNRSGQFDYPYSVAVAPDGRIVSADIGNGVQVFHPNGTFDLGWYVGEVRGVNHPTPLAEVAVAPDGKIVVATVIVPGQLMPYGVGVFHPNGTRAFDFLSYYGSPRYGGTPTGVAVAPDGRILVAAGNLYGFDADGTPSFAFGGRGGYANEPSGVAVAHDGKIAVSDHHSHRIRVLDAGGALVRTIGSFGSGTGQLQYPQDIDIGGPDGRIAVVDGRPLFWANPDRIQVFHPNGTFAFSIGPHDVDDEAAGPFYPSDVAVAPDGRIVAAYNNDYRVRGPWGPLDPHVRVFDADGTFSFAFRPPPDGLPCSLHGVDVAPDGRIVVATSANCLGGGSRSSIQAYHPNGTFDTTIKSGAYWDVAVAPDGWIAAVNYVGHRANYRANIQVFDSSGVGHSNIGTKGAGAGQFSWGVPDIAVAPDGRIVVADNSNDRIQVFQRDGTLDRILGSSNLGFAAGAGPLRSPAGVAIGPAQPPVVVEPPPPFNGTGPPLAPNGTAPQPPVVVEPPPPFNGTGPPLAPNGTAPQPPIVVEPPPPFNGTGPPLAPNGTAPQPPVVVEPPPPFNGTGPPPAPPPPAVAGPGGGIGTPGFAGVGAASQLVIDVARLADSSASQISGDPNASTATFPPRETAVVTPFVEVTFPPSVTASRVPSDGLLALNVSAEAPPDEQVQRALAYAGSGRVVPQRIVEVGGSNSGGGAERVTFDQPVRIVLEGQAGGRAFYIQSAGGAIMPIDAACAADDTARVHRQLAGAGECWVDSADGNDKIIYTYHFTRFGTVVSENGALPPVVHTCSARLGTPNLDVSASLGEQSSPVQQALINSGSLPFARVELEATPWYVDWDGSAPPAAGHPSLPSSISEVLFEDVDFGHVATAVNGTVVARGLGGGDIAPLSFVADLTPYDEVQGSALVQYVTYLAQCSR